MSLSLSLSYEKVMPDPWQLKGICFFGSWRPWDLWFKIFIFSTSCGAGEPHHLRKQGDRPVGLDAGEHANDQRWRRRFVERWGRSRRRGISSDSKARLFGSSENTSGIRFSLCNFGLLMDSEPRALWGSFSRNLTNAGRGGSSALAFYLPAGLSCSILVLQALFGLRWDARLPASSAFCSLSTKQDRRCEGQGVGLWGRPSTKVMART